MEHLVQYLYLDFHLEFFEVGGYEIFSYLIRCIRTWIPVVRFSCYINGNEN